MDHPWCTPDRDSHVMPRLTSALADRMDHPCRSDQDFRGGKPCQSWQRGWDSGAGGDVASKVDRRRGPGSGPSDFASSATRRSVRGSCGGVRRCDRWYRYRPGYGRGTPRLPRLAFASGTARKLESSPRWMKIRPVRVPSGARAAHPRPLLGSPSSWPSHVNSTPGSPSRSDWRTSIHASTAMNRNEPLSSESNSIRAGPTISMAFLSHSSISVIRHRPETLGTPPGG